ncbi:MAG: hypothetical protein WAM60_21335 [Candidatus Promineifilaceae bacterium]
MANLTEVRTALKAGDKQKAAQILKVVLKEKPSADAWVLAAKLSSNPDTAKQHLQRALSFDSKNATARDMLRDLGGEQKSYHANLMEEVKIGMEEFGQNSRLLSRLNPNQRVILVTGVFVLVFITSGILLANLARPAEVEQRELPPIPTVAVIATDSLLTSFSGSGLNIADIHQVDPLPDTSISEQVEMTVQDAAGSYPATVFMYTDIDGLVKDRLRLASLGASNRIVVNQTAVLVYPLEVDPVTADSLESVFNSVAGS